MEIMASINKWMPFAIMLSFGLLLTLDPTEGRKQGGKRKTDAGDDDGDAEQRPNTRYPLSQSLDSDRSNGFLGLQKDTETSAQAINPAVQNPLLYQNQGFGGVGGLSNLGGGVFSNQAQLGGLGGVGGFGGGIFSNQAQGGLGGYQNPYLGGGYQNPYLGGGYQNSYLGGGFNGLGGGFGGIGGVAPDIYTQGALSAQLYNNPLYGAGAGTLTGAAAGINPLLLRGVQNSQYPVIGGLGNYNNPYLGSNNPYLAAQALLSPYSNYNQLNQYPFSSRFGIGSGAGRSGIGGNRFNTQSQNSRNNNDE